MVPPTSSPAGYKPEGRLGDPNMNVGDDPRLSRRLLEALKPVGLDKRQPEPEGLTIASPLEEFHAYMGEADKNMQALYDMQDPSIPEDKDEPKVEHTITTIKGVDHNDIDLHVFRKAGTEGEKLPGLLYTHGGGMTIVSTINKIHVRWLTSLAVAGLVAIAVDFRNAYNREKKTHHPFPAGLNDCVSAAKYITGHKSEFGITKLVIQGESGGGNLTLATTLKAHKEGWSDQIAGAVGVIPFISNGWGWPEERRLKELPSTVASNGYFLGLKFMELMGHYYTPEEKDKTNPLAWPYHATEDELKGLPQHYIIVDELDPLRDEGLKYYQKLSAAGVKVAGHVSLGSIHGSWGIFRSAVPEMNQAFVDSIAGFAKRV